VKRTRALPAVAVVASLALTACGDSAEGGTGGGDDAPEEYVVGWINPLSGASAAFGEISQCGVELALADIEEDGWIDGTPMRVAFEDNELEPAASITAFERLMGEEPVTVMTAGSSVVLALSPLAEQNEMMLANVGAQSPELIKPEYPNVYNFIPTSAAEAARLAERLYEDLDISSVATLFVDNDYGIDTSEAFTTAFEELGGEVVAAERHELGSTDMRNQLIQIRGSEAEGIVIASNVGEVGHAVSQIDELGIDAPVFGFTYALSPDNFEIAGDAMDGMRGVAVSFLGEGEKGQDFAARFEEECGTAPNATAAVSYDATRMIAEGLAEVGNDRQALMEYIAGVEGYEGVLGTTTMTENRESEFPLNEYEISGSEVGSWG
jgi:branched-chain amino acid transport system substrate-binding protein